MRRRAGNETRTRDPNLGKVVLYQLSYSRIPIVNDANIHASQGFCQTDFLALSPSPFMSKDLVFSTGLYTYGDLYVLTFRNVPDIAEIKTGTCGQPRNRYVYNVLTGFNQSSF